MNLQQIRPSNYIVDCGNFEYNDRNNPIPVESDVTLESNTCYLASYYLQNGPMILHIVNVLEVQHNLFMPFMIKAKLEDGFLQTANMRIKAITKDIYDNKEKIYVGMINSMLKIGEEQSYEPHLEIQGTIK